MAQLNESHGRIQAPPRTEDVKVLRNYVADLANMLAKLAKDLDFIINGNLDVKNIRANSITADRMDVEELSAISANLGEITAGIIRGINIFGSFFATAEEGYPRIEISGDNKYIKLFLSEEIYLEIVHAGEEGFPQISYVRNGERVSMGHGIATAVNPGDPSYPGIFSSLPFVMFAFGGLYLPGFVNFSNWSFLVNGDTSKSLQEELQEMRDSITALQSAVGNKAEKGANTSAAGAHNHGIPDGTVLMTSTGTVTFHASGGHSHTQN